MLGFREFLGQQSHRGAGKAGCQERVRHFHTRPTKPCLINFFYLVVPELCSLQQMSNRKCFPEFQESLKNYQPK